MVLLRSRRHLDFHWNSGHDEGLKDKVTAPREVMQAFQQRHGVYWEDKCVKMKLHVLFERPMGLEIINIL